MVWVLTGLIGGADCPSRYGNRKLQNATMLSVELDWLPDAEFLGRIGRDALAVVLERLAPVLARQGVALPDAGLPDALYFPKLAAVLRA